MSGFLLDTNIPSEMTRSRPARQVQQWLNDVDDDQLFLSVVSLAEILRGSHRLPATSTAPTLINGSLRPCAHGSRVAFCWTQAIAERVGRLAGERDAQGLAIPFADGLIAATALEHGLTVVTRNVKDFYGLGVAILNPWNV